MRKLPKSMVTLRSEIGVLVSIRAQYSTNYKLRTMNTRSESQPQWERYRSLIDETSELEYNIIGILSTALCRREGNGQPNKEELSIIQEMKNRLHPKLKELKHLQADVSELIKMERESSSNRISA
jgi:hypothetical protein